MSLLKKLLGGGPKVPQDRTSEILRRHLSADHTVYPLAERRTPEEAVLEVGRRLEVPLPPEVVAHLAGEFPGIFVEAKERVWPRPKEYEVGPFWSFLYAVHTFTASADSADSIRMESTAKRLFDTTGHRFAPVLKVVGDADLYCVDGAGALVRFDHESGELTKVDLGFFELLDREIGDLRKRTEQKKKGEDKR